MFEISVEKFITVSRRNTRCSLLLPSPPLVARWARTAGPSSRSGPSLLFFLLTLSFFLSPSYTDRGRFQPSSRLPLMDRRLRRSGSRVRHRVDRVVRFQLRAPKLACVSRSTTSRFPWPRPSGHRSVLRSPIRDACSPIVLRTLRKENAPPLSSAR